MTLLVQQDQSKESRPTADKDRLQAIVAQGDLGLPALAGQAGVFGQADLEGQPITPGGGAGRLACPNGSRAGGGKGGSGGPGDNRRLAGCFLCEVDWRWGDRCGGGRWSFSGE